MIKICYYNDVTENELLEVDAEKVSYEELIEELYYLEDDNTSYIMILLENRKIKIISDDYDLYLILEFDVKKKGFNKIITLDFKELKLFMLENINPDSTYDEIDLIPTEDNKNKKKNTNKIQNNLKREDPKRFSLLD